MKYVYFIRDVECDLIKIGIAQHVIARFFGARTFNPHTLTLVGVAEGGAEFERALHLRFAGSKVAREWFSPSDELKAIIAAHSMTAAEFLETFECSRSDTMDRIADILRLPGYDTINAADYVTAQFRAKKKQRAA
jgi:hypothetical protein